MVPTIASYCLPSMCMNMAHVYMYCSSPVEQWHVSVTATTFGKILAADEDGHEINNVMHSLKDCNQKKVLLYCLL